MTAAAASPLTRKLSAFVALSEAELAALARLRKADDVREGAARAHRSADRGAALAALDTLDRFYRDRPDLTAARAALSDKRGDVMDGFS